MKTKRFTDYEGAFPFELSHDEKYLYCSGFRISMICDSSTLEVISTFPGERWGFFSQEEDKIGIVYDKNIIIHDFSGNVLQTIDYNFRKGGPRIAWLTRDKLIFDHLHIGYSKLNNKFVSVDLETGNMDIVYPVLPKKARTITPIYSEYGPKWISFDYGYMDTNEIPRDIVDARVYEFDEKSNYYTKDTESNLNMNIGNKCQLSNGMYFHENNILFEENMTVIYSHISLGNRKILINNSGYDDSPKEQYLEYGIIGDFVYLVQQFLAMQIKLTKYDVCQIFKLLGKLLYIPSTDILIARDLMYDYNDLPEIEIIKEEKYSYTITRTQLSVETDLDGCIIEFSFK